MFSSLLYLIIIMLFLTFGLQNYANLFNCASFSQKNMIYEL
jgi:hypothetical protein